MCRGDGDRCRPRRSESPAPSAHHLERGRRRTRLRTPSRLVPPALDRSGTGRPAAFRSRSHWPTRSRLSRSTDFALAPLPMAELISTSFNDGFRPSQCRARPSRNPSPQSGVMSEWPMVWSIGWRSCRYLNGLSGSMRPRPQSGRSSIHANSFWCRCSARLVPGISSMRYESDSVQESVPILPISASMSPALNRGSAAACFEEARECLGSQETSSHRPARRLRERARCGAIRRGVTESAVDRHPRGAEDILLREADRQLAAGFPDEPKRRVAARELVGEHPRQHLPDPVGNAFLGLDTDRSVLEMLDARVGLTGHLETSKADTQHSTTSSTARSGSHNVFRNSISASRSAGGSSRPYR